MKQITIDRTKRLFQAPHTGHNRWHPDIEPVLEAAPGEEVMLETRDAADGQIRDGMTVDGLAGMDTKVAHRSSARSRARSWLRGRRIVKRNAQLANPAPVSGGGEIIANCAGARVARGVSTDADAAKVALRTPSWPPG